MITIVDPEKQYIPRNGDVLWGAAANWAAPRSFDKPSQERVSGLKLNVLDGTEFKDNQILLVSRINVNPMAAMKVIGIGLDFFCPKKDTYTEHEGVYGIVPTAVLSDDVSKYEKSMMKSINEYGSNQLVDLALDQEFVKESIANGGCTVEGNHLYSEYAEVFGLNDIQELMMGSGYTFGCNMHDGSHARIPAKVKLSNGDWLFVWFWEWYGN